MHMPIMSVAHVPELLDLVEKGFTPDFFVPEIANPGDAGFDLRSRIDKAIAPMGRELIPTGIKVAIEPGFAGLVCPRSGMALKRGLTVLNAPGVVDSGYRGEVGVILYNAGHQIEHIAIGDKVAQLVITRIETPHVTLVDELDETERGDGGFGSTGR